MAKRKSLDLIALLMISFLVITASAAVYYSLSQTTTVTIAGTAVWFEVGSDNGTACTVVLSPDKTVATVTGLKAYPNATQTYENSTLVHNNSTSTIYEVRLRPISFNNDTTEFVFVKFTLNASVGSRVLNYTCDGTNWNMPSTTDWVQLDTSEDAPIIIETKARDSATEGGSVTIEIAVDVKQ